MANIVRRRDERGVGMPAAAFGWDPFRLMQELITWDPFRSDPDRLGAPAYSPRFDVKETADGWLVAADLPGVEEEDIDVQVTADRLTVSGRRYAERHDEGETYHAHERAYGAFTRSFALPHGIDVDHVTAELERGVLTIHLPRREEARPRKISISGIVRKVKRLGAGDKAA